MNYHSFDSINNISKNYSLNILTSNVQSLRKNYDELSTTVRDLHHPQILALSELWSPPETLLNLDLYQKPLIKLRKSTGGGVGIWVKRGIQILKKDNLDHLKLTCIEAISVTIQIQHKKHTIVNIYKPPLKPVNTTLKELKLVLELFSNHHTTITGDLNIDYLQSELSIIKNYKELLDEYFFHQSVKIATRITNKSRTLIDHSVTNIPHSMEANVLIHAIADHQTVLSSIYPKRENTKKETPIHSTRTLLKESIESIKNNIDWHAQIATLNSLNTNQGTQHLQNILTDNLVTKNFKIKSKKPTNKPWMNEEGLKLRTEAYNLKKKFLKSSTEDNERRYKLAKKNYNTTLVKLKQQYYHKQIFNAKGDGKKIWATINESLNRKRKIEEEINLKNHLNMEISDPEEVCNNFNDYFINLAPELASQIQPPDIPMEDLLINAPKPNKKFQLKPITLEEVKKIISTLKPKASSGSDNISNLLIKEIMDIISEPLMILINKSFTEGIFPDCLKLAKMIPLFKNGCKQSTCNYRGINMLSTLSKIFEKASLNQIKPHLIDNDIITESQFGFLPKHSTVHPIILTLDHLQRQQNLGLAVLFFAIDLKKAFDTICSSKILPKKLEHYNFDKNSINWITSFFTNRQQFVQIKNTRSEIKKLFDISVTQGSRMGPDFFNIYINDLVYNTELEPYLFADDTTLLDSHKDQKKLQEHANIEINKIQNFMQANKLSLNLTKTNYMIFKNSKKDKEFELKIKDYTIQEVNEIKFLGINIPTDLKFTSHYNHVISKMKSGLAALNMIKKTLPTRTKLQIFNALIKPHYEYASIVWTPNLTKAQMNKIITLQKQGLKMVYSTHRMSHSSVLFIKSGITRFDLLFKKSVMELIHKHEQILLPRKLTKALNELTKSKNTRKNNFRIPSIYKKGDLFYEILNTWNNLPNDMKDIPATHSKSKSMISNFIKNEYELCTTKNCKSCEVTPFEDIMSNINELRISFS